jgi:hypothetical protein
VKFPHYNCRYQEHGGCDGHPSNLGGLARSFAEGHEVVEARRAVAHMIAPLLRFIPIIVAHGHGLEDLLLETSNAIRVGNALEKKCLPASSSFCSSCLEKSFILG